MSDEHENEPPIDEPEVPAIDEPEAENAPLQLSTAEIERIQNEAAKQVAKELAKRREAALKELFEKSLADEILTQRRAAGLTDHYDDILDIFINVAPFTNQIVIDGTVYQHGQWVKCDRRKYESIREILAAGWASEERAGNPNQKFDRFRAQALPYSTTQTEARMADGTFTVGLQHKINGLTGAVASKPAALGA